VNFFFWLLLAVQQPSAALPMALARSKPIEVFARPLSSDSATEQRIGVADEVLWFITPARKMRRYRLGKFVDEIALPAEMDIKPGAASIAPVNAKSVWVLDRDRRALWRLRDGAWAGPFPIGEKVFGAAALPDGSVAIGTPNHSSSAFAVVSPDGQIIRRFGGRLTPPAFALTQSSNTWLLATSASGDVFAAHVYRPILRRYDSAGKLKWERMPAIEPIPQMESARHAAEAELRTNAVTCCFEAKLIRFATNLVATNIGVAVRFGTAPRLDVFDENGEWQRSLGVPVSDGPTSAWLNAGVVAADGGLVACELSHLVMYPVASLSSALRGVVVGPDRHPIDGAAVSVKLVNGTRLKAKTTPAGSFIISGLPAAAGGEVRVTADGFLDFAKTGILADIMASPIALAPEARQCVVVSDGATRKSIEHFWLSVGRIEEGTGRISRNMGRQQEFSVSDGKACLSSPVTPPLSVRVRADGYATKEVIVSDPASQVVDVPLSREARLSVRLRDESRASIANAKVYVQSATVEKRTSLVLTDDVIATSDHDGIAALKGLSPDEYRVSVEHPNYIAVEKTAHLASGDNSLDVLLERGTDIVAVVTAGSERVADAVVRAEGQGQKLLDKLECKTGPDGTCTISGAPPGRYLVQAIASGRTRASQSLVVAPGDQRRAVEIHVGSAIRLLGHVSGMAAYTDAELDFQIMKPGVPAVSVPVDPNGTFRVNEAPSGVVNIWLYERKGNSALLYKSVEIPDAPEYNLELELPPPLTLRGRVTSAGSACAACNLTFDLLGSQFGRPSRRVNATIDGSFVVQLPVAGSYRATVVDSSTNASLVRLEHLNTSSTVNYDLGGDTMTVNVTDISRHAVAGAMVEVSTEAGALGSQTTDSAGVARFTSVVQGRYRVNATLRGRIASQVLDVDGNTNVDLQLPDTAPLQLRVVDAGSALAVPMISARVISARGEVTVARSVIGSNGLFVVPGFQAEPLTVVISARGYSVRTIRGLTLSSEAQTIAMKTDNRGFMVQVSDSIQPCRFEVRDASGLPIALNVEMNPGPAPLFVRDAAFFSMEAGTFTAILYDCNGKQLAQTFQLAPGQTPVVRFK
jgi:hypothetical protein